MAQLMDELPSEIVKKIRNALAPPQRVADMNCGKFINTMSNRYGSLKKYKEELRRSVIKTFEKVEIILYHSYYLQHASMLTSKPTMWVRTQEALRDARDAQTVAQLVHLCQQVPQWKQEAKQIVQKLDELVQHMKLYLSTGKTKENVLGTLRLLPDSRFILFGIFQSFDPSHPPNRKRISIELQHLQENLPKDIAAVEALFAPLQVSPDPKNCEEWWRSTNGKFIGPRAFAKFKDIVLKTLRQFCRDIDKTKFIKKSAIVDPRTVFASNTMPMKKRVEEAIATVPDIWEPFQLVNVCAQVGKWKREADLIFKRLKEYIHYLETYAETGKQQNEPLKNLVVDSMKASMHTVIPGLDWKKDSRTLRQYIGQYKSCLSADKEMLAILLAPVDIR